MNVDEKVILSNCKVARTLGIVSLVVSLLAPTLLFFGVIIAVVCGLNALTLYKKNVVFYRSQPDTYGGFKVLRTALYCGIAGLVVSGCEIVLMMVNYGKDGLN